MLLNIKIWVQMLVLSSSTSLTVNFPKARPPQSAANILKNPGVSTYITPGVLLRCVGIL